MYPGITPTIELQAAGKNQVITFKGLVDTGANVNLISSDFVVFLAEAGVGFRSEEPGRQVCMNAIYFGNETVRGVVRTVDLIMGKSTASDVELVEIPGPVFQQMLERMSYPEPTKKEIKVMIGGITLRESEGWKLMMEVVRKFME